MIKYFCDLCGKEVEDQAGLFRVYDASVQGEKEFCKNCEKLWKKASTRIEQRCSDIKKEATQKMKEIEKEEFARVLEEAK